MVLASHALDGEAGAIKRVHGMGISMHFCFDGLAWGVPEEF